jgi:hypothetical protein
MTTSLREAARAQSGQAMNHYRKPPLSADAIAKASGASIMAMILSLDLRLKRNGPHELTGPCPRCLGVDRFNINTTKGAWFCRGCGAKGGDGISLLMHVRELEFREAVEDINGEGSDDRPAPAPAPIEAKPKRQDDDEAAREAFIRRMVEKTLRGIVPICGTPGEVYLRDVRKIDTGAIADVLNSTAAIGWRPECFFQEPGHRLDQQRLGCIVGVMTDPITALPTGAISRTYLTPDLKKIGKAKTLGAPMGIVRLSPDDEVLEGLFLAEGLETALAAMSIGLRPVWSTGSTALMASFPVLAGISALNILVDHDLNGAGEKAAREAEARWRSAGREVDLSRPISRGDFNDVLAGGDR